MGRISIGIIGFNQLDAFKPITAEEAPTDNPINKRIEYMMVRGRIQFVFPPLKPTNES